MILNYKIYFPIFQKLYKEYDISYLDNSSTTHKPKSVIDIFSNYYSNINNNISRSSNLINSINIESFYLVRKKVKNFLLKIIKIFR